MITNFSDVTQSIWFFTLLIIAVAALLFIAFCISKFLVRIGRMQKEDHISYLSFKAEQQDINNVVLSGITQLNETTSALIGFTKMTEEHIKSNKQESRALRNFFLQFQGNMVEFKDSLNKISNLYEQHDKRLNGIEERVGEIYDSFVLKCNGNGDGKQS